MIVRTGSGWQTVLADLSLILFMVAVAAVSEGKGAASPSPASEPVAVWRAGAGAPSLAQWLAAQPHDPRQRLTILASYQRDPSVITALAVAAARQAGAGTRIVIEPGGADGLAASLAYDAPPQLARALQSEGEDPAS